MVQRDDAACEVIEHHLSQVVRAWLGCHPRQEIAYRLASEASYVTRTCEPFWQGAVHQGQALDRLATALRYVRACLNSVILDTLRACAYATAIPLPGAPRSGRAAGGCRAAVRAAWQRIRGMVPTE